MTSNLDLSKLNELNQNTPGLICFVTNQENTLVPIFKLEDFNPEEHEIAFPQIWTTEQEQIVRLAIEEEMQNCFSFDDTDIVDYKIVANLQMMLIEWLDSKEDLTAGGLSD